MTDDTKPAPPSPDAVRRFSCHTQEDGVYESRTGEHVAYTDYAALAAALRRERERAERAESEARLWLGEYNRLRQEIADATERCVAHLDERDALSRNNDTLIRLVGKIGAECDALRADAERYRWLRAAQSQTARNWIVINNRNMYGEHELDAAIDAARKA